MGWVKKIFILFLLLGFFGAILKFVKHTPYFYAGISLFLVLLVMFFRTKQSTNFKAFLFNLAIMVLFLSLAEAYCAGWFSSVLTKQPKEAARLSYFVPDEIRGYAAAKNAKITSKLSHGHKVIYDVIYNTNQHGLRVSPHDIKKNKILKNKFKNVVFFGCSFTVGEGVNDNETLPYLFEEMSNGNYVAYNFGFHGYGPQQMLRILETGLLDKIITNKESLIVIYWALTGHVERCCGNYPYFLWDTAGPRYKLNSSGEVEFTGKFNENESKKSFIERKLILYLNKSYLLQDINIIDKLGFNRDKKDIELFIQIISKSQEIVANRYQGKFYVILKSEKRDKDYDYILSELKRKNLQIITTNEIFSQYNDPEDSYYIKGDGHPSKLAYERMADYLMRNLHLWVKDEGEVLPSPPRAVYPIPAAGP